MITLAENYSMQKIIAFLLTFSIVLELSAQTSPRLIVRGDDMGFSHACNEAIVKTFKEGIETSIEIIVPSPWFLEAVKFLNENPTVDVGVHLALTSEWDNVKWRPLTEAKSLRDSNGYFYPKINPDKFYPNQSLSENKFTLSDIETELRAQIEMAKKYIPRISHVSAHMGCTSLSPEVKALERKLTKEYKIDIDLEDYKVIYAGYKGSHSTLSEKIEGFTKMLKSLEIGKTYLFVDHPALDGAEMRAVHHINYENVATDRQGVTDLWTNVGIKALIKKLGIQLISYADLKNKSK